MQVTSSWASIGEPLSAESTVEIGASSRWLGLWTWFGSEKRIAAHQLFGRDCNHALARFCRHEGHSRRGRFHPRTLGRHHTGDVTRRDSRSSTRPPRVRAPAVEKPALEVEPRRPREVLGGHLDTEGHQFPKLPFITSIGDFSKLLSEPSHVSREATSADRGASPADLLGVAGASLPLMDPLPNPFNPAGASFRFGPTRPYNPAATTRWDCHGRGRVGRSM
jgi:hypothetical protein